MAQRPVFTPRIRAPYYNVHDVEFQWNPGLNIVQKQKNIEAIHRAFSRQFPEKEALEISSKSLQPGGTALSAFNLPIYVPALGREVPVECAYHAGKVFSNGGPYTDLLEVSPRAAKKDPRLKESGRLTGFVFGDVTFPVEAGTAFYNWLYIRALLEHPDLAAVLLQYQGFTDIEYNPQKSRACQARAAAIYVSFFRQGLLEGDFRQYL